MTAYRCSICGISWPFRSEYNPCPQCGDHIDRPCNATPISEVEAKSLKAHADFERYYEERERKKRQEADAAFLEQSRIRP
jgi:hypothetical protein